MKIVNIKIENFRSYKNETTIPLNDLTVLIGKNDAGKSTVLEGLDIFFNDSKGRVKAEPNDININLKTSEKSFSISVTFTDFPKEIIIDSSAKTNLKDEYLLNDSGFLEIKKEYKITGNKIAPTVYIVANHPSNESCSNLLSMKNADLKKKVEELNIKCPNKKINNLMRKAIWEHFSKDLKLKNRLISTDKEDAEKILKFINAQLPTYTLFQSDRQNKDNDVEVQDPLKAATKEILKNEKIGQELSKIAKKVKEELSKVADATLDKLKKLDPKIAKKISPEIPDSDSLKWADVFKNVSITGDSIPINKRGSGVRRLILLSFFMAEAEKNNSSNVIYAFEEPETSQHADNQIMLIDAFKKISFQPNKQVILTTHSNDIVNELDIENLVMITDDSKHKIIDLENTLLHNSLNEASYIAFGHPTEGYHDELYSLIEKNNKLKELEKISRELFYIEERNGKPLKPKQICLSEYIRHQIHHPENKNNKPFSRKDLRESIDIMRKFISDQNI